MAWFNHSDNLSDTEADQRQRYWAWLWAAGVIVGVGLVGVGALALNLNHIKRQAAVSVGAVYHEHFAGPNLFKSSYFEFKDANQWIYAPNDSTPSKITYLLYAGGVLAQSLTVYVNQTPIPDNLAVTRVLPVNIVGGNRLVETGSVSAACGSFYSPGTLMREYNIAVSGSSIYCQPDSPAYKVAVGQVGGSDKLILKRSDGTLASYIIIYNNLSTDPDPTALINLINTFQAI